MDKNGKCRTIDSSCSIRRRKNISRLLYGIDSICCMYVLYERAGETYSRARLEILRSWDVTYYYIYVCVDAWIHGVHSLHNIGVTYVSTDILRRGERAWRMIHPYCDTDLVVYSMRQTERRFARVSKTLTKAQKN